VAEELRKGAEMYSRDSSIETFPVLSN